MKRVVGRPGPLTLALIGLLLVQPWVSKANAGVVSGTRSPWALGAGWNFGRGTFEVQGGEKQKYREGSAAQIRVAHRLGDHLQVGVDYQGWAVEFADIDIQSNPVKFRRSLQNLCASLTVFPGKPQTALGGWYVRGGVGLGWSGTGAKEVIIGEETVEGVRKDSWGVGFLAETGYEIWVSGHFSVAPGLSFNYLQIGEDDYLVGTQTIRGVDRAGFLSAQITFNAYFGGDR